MIGSHEIWRSDSGPEEEDSDAVCGSNYSRIITIPVIGKYYYAPDHHSSE